MIEMQAVESSNILEIGYDEDGEVLYITFNSGITYSYDMVPVAVYEEFLKADSVGQYFNKNIKGHYEFYKCG